MGREVMGVERLSVLLRLGREIKIELSRAEGRLGATGVRCARLNSSGMLGASCPSLQRPIGGSGHEHDGGSEMHPRPPQGTGTSSPCPYFL